MALGTIYRRSTDVIGRQAALLIELEAAFCVLAVAGLLRQMLGSYYPWYAWTMVGVYAAFAVAWIWALVRK